MVFVEMMCKDHLRQRQTLHNVCMTKDSLAAHFKKVSSAELTFALPDLPALGET